MLYLFDLVYSKELVCFYLHKLGVYFGIFPMLLELEFERIPSPINANKEEEDWLYRGFDNLFLYFEKPLMWVSQELSGLSVLLFLGLLYLM